MALAVTGGDLVAGQPLSDADYHHSQLMGIIRSHYMKALNRLPPWLIPRVREFGFCFGFLDPVSNIILNTFYGVSSDEKQANWKEQRNRGEKRKRSQPGIRRSKSAEFMEMKEARLSKEDEVSSISMEDEISLFITGAKSMVARSLQGLVTFLTSFFRYLHTNEALFYLFHTDGDLLAAVHLIEKLRACHAFAMDHPTSKIALACAARAALCPQPDKLVLSTIALASRMEEFHTLLQHPRVSQGRLSNTISETISAICSEGGTHRQASSICAFARLCELDLPSTRSLGVDHKLSIRRVLLDRIHGFYLDAISRMPTALLRSRLHRALLMAGHCYGPFDPVANILLNTIWYDTAFPPQLEFEVGMIRMESLALVELRSLDGLVAFFHTIDPHADKSDNAYELRVFDLIQKLVFSLQPLDRCYDAFQSAANAAFHPNPTALAYFAASLPQAVRATLEPLLKAKCLSAIDVQTISKVLSENHPPHEPVGKVRWTPRLSLNSGRLKEFEAQQTLIHRRVEAAFQNYARIKGAAEYEEYKVHAICGVNSEIPEDGRFGYFHNHDGYPFSHINVWVIWSRHADAAPELWFIEYSNDPDNKEAAPFLSPVSESTESSGRCFHCEYAGTKIMHPSSGSYRGQRKDFLDMACGEHSVTNEELIRFGEVGTVFADSVEIEDFVEFEGEDLEDEYLGNEDDEDSENEDDEDLQDEDDEDLKENEDDEDKQLIYA